MATSAMNGEEKKQTAKQDRVQIHKKIGICIPLSRVITRAKKAITNPVLENELKVLSDRIENVKAGKADKDSKNVEELKKMHDEKKSTQPRIGEGAKVTLATTTDFVTRQMLKHAFEKSLSHKPKPASPVPCSQFYLNIETLSGVYPFLSSLPSFASRSYLNDDNKEDELFDKLSPEEKKKKSKEGFKTYINEIISELKEKDKKYENIRVSTPLKNLCDKIIQEMISVITRMSEHSQAINGVKTMTKTHVTNSIHMIMLYHGVTKDKYQELLQYNENKMAIYVDYKKSVKTKKNEEKINKLSPEEKKKLEEKTAAEKKEKKRAGALRKKEKAEKDLAALNNPAPSGGK
jgi:hypothetical protein